MSAAMACASDHLVARCRGAAGFDVLSRPGAMPAATGAIELCREAIRAHPNHADLPAYLGLALLDNGRMAEGIPLVRDAAGRGSAPAQYQLGVMLAEGLGVAQDEAQAAAWVGKAAEQGYDRAQFHLGWMYDTGRVVAEHAGKALVWYHRAARQGNRDAAFNLSVLLADQYFPDALLLEELGETGRTEVIAGLAALLGDKKGEVEARRAAAEALTKLKAPEAVPALIAALETDADPAVRTAAATGLREQAALGAVPALLAALGDTDPGVRRAARLALGEMQTPDAMPALLAALRDDDPRARAAAARHLSELGRLEALPPLLAGLRDPDPDVRGNAAWSLGRLRAREAAPVLVAALRDKSGDVRAKAAEALAQLGAPEAAPALAAALADRDAGVRRVSAWALASLKAPDAAPALIAALTDNDAQVREGVEWALAGLKTPAVVRALIAALANGNARVRAGAATALGLQPATEATAALIAALRDRDREVRLAAAQALEDLETAAPEAVPALIALLGDKDPDLRRQAKWALGRLKAPEAVPALIATLKGADPDLRRAAATVLGRRKAAEAVPTLLAALGDTNPDVRQAVAEALGRHQVAEAASALVRALGDTDAGVRRAAAESLGRHRAPGVVPVLLATLRDEDPQTGDQAAKALVRLRAPEALPGLISALGDRELSVRVYAARHLVKFAAPEAAPALIAALGDASYEVRRLAADALGRLDSAQTAPILLKALHANAIPATPVTWVFHAWNRLDLLSPLQAIRTTRWEGLPGDSRSRLWVAYLTDRTDSTSDEERTILLGRIDRTHDAPPRDPSAIGRQVAGQLGYPLDDSPLAQSLLGKWRLESGEYATVLDDSERALARLRPHERALAIYLRWQRAEALLALKDAEGALAETGRIERELLPRLAGLERRWSGLFFEAQTLVLKGKALLLAGRAQAAVQALLAAEPALERDRQLAGIVGQDEASEADRYFEAALTRDLDEDDIEHLRTFGIGVNDEDVRRMQLLIRGIRAQAQWDSAGRDAQAAIELGRGLTLRRRLEVETSESAFLVGIRHAVGEGDYDRAHRLTEEYVTQRQRWDERQGLTSASPTRRAALERIDGLRRGIAEAEARLERARHADRGGAGATDANSGDRQAELARLSGERAEARRALQQFFIQLRQAHPEVALLLGARPTELARLQGLLKPGQLILQYLLLEELGYAFLITADAIQTRELAIGSKRLGPLVGAYRQLLQGKSVCADHLRGAVRRDGCRDSLRDAAPLAHELSQHLLNPVKDRLTGVQRLTVVPNGPLHELPFAALPLDDRPLLEQTVLNQLGSASLLSLAGRKGGQSGPTLALAVPQAPGWDPLGHVAGEVESIRGKLADTEVRIGPQAVSAALTGRDLGGRPLHLATHAKAASPAETRLALADRDLRLEEVWGLALDGSPRVVLSACQTGLGERVSGDEVVSLANGFLFAGARSVVASLWPVPDAPTRRLMELFYGRLAEGNDTPTALALAQREMARGHPPYVWAAFTVTGE
jgi:HEAT repeat protein